jgi:hypothetical protein
LQYWDDTNPDEIHGLVGLEIAMGMCEKQELSDYFEKYWLTSSPGFGTIFSRNRYQLLRSFLHMNNNEDRVERGQPGYSPTFKVQPIIDMVQDQYVKLYQAHHEISVDEAMLGFKGKLGIKQYIQDKPTKWGIKLWCLCDSHTDFMMRWNVCAGSGDGTVSETVRRLLTPDYLDCGYYLFCDNLYSSTNLFFELKDRRTGTCGTLRSNRVGNHTCSSVYSCHTEERRGPYLLYQGGYAVYLLAGQWNC